MREQTPTRRATAIIFLIVFLDLLGVGIIAPLSPYLVGRFESSGTAVAVLTLAYSAAQFLAAPVLGLLSDRFGRRRVLIISMAGSALGYVLFALAGSYHLLLVARVIDGVTGGNISTAQAAIADVTPPKERAKAYGMIGAAFGLGFLLGPVFSALISQAARWALGEQGVQSHAAVLAPIWAAAALSAGTTLLVVLFLPETLPPGRRRREPVGFLELNPLGVLAAVLALPHVRGVLAAIFALGLAHAHLRASFGVLMRDRFGFHESDAGWIFAFLGLVAVLVQGGLVRAVVPRLGERRTALAGLPLAVAGYTLLPLAAGVAGVYGAIALSATGMGLATPAMAGLLSRSVAPEMQGETMGASQGVQSLALVVGPLIAGELYDHAGKGWPFWTAALVIAAGWLMILAIRPAPPAPTPARCG